MTALQVRKIMSDIDAFEAELRAKAPISVSFHAGPQPKPDIYPGADVVFCTRYQERPKCGPGWDAVKSDRAAE